MTNNNAIITLVVVLLILGGFLYFANRDDSKGEAPPSPTSTVESGTPGAGDYNDTPDTPIESTATPAAQSARIVLAARLGINPADITIKTVEKTEWPNGCLGLAKAGEMCTQAIVDGYRVTLEANGQSYAYRTNEFGTSARLEQ